MAFEIASEALVYLLLMAAGYPANANGFNKPSSSFFTPGIFMPWYGGERGSTESEVSFAEKRIVWRTVQYWSVAAKFIAAPHQ